MVDKINGNGSYDLPGSGAKHKRKNPAVRAYEETPGFHDAGRKKTQPVRGKDKQAAEKKDAGVILDLSASPAGKKKEASAAANKKEGSWTGVLRKLFQPVVRWLKDFWESDSSGADGAEPFETDIELPPLEADGADELSDVGAVDASDGAEGVLETADGKSGVEMTEAADGRSGFGMTGAADGRFSVEMTEATAADGRSGVQVAADLKEAASVLRSQAAQPVETSEWKTLVDRAVKSGNLRQIEQLVTDNGAKRLAHNSDLLTYYDRRGKFVEMDETEKYRVLFGDKNVMKL